MKNLLYKPLFAGLMLLAMLVAPYPLSAQTYLNPGDDVDAAIEASGGGTIFLNAGFYSGRIQLNGKRFSEEHPLLIKAAPGAQVTLVGDPSSGRNTELTNCSYIIFDSIHFNQSKFEGVWLEECDHIIFKNCEISETGQAGIKVALRSKHVDLINVKIHSTGKTAAQWGEGIYLGRGSGHEPSNWPDNTEFVWIEGCEIYNTGAGEAINVKGEVFNTTIRNNHIHDIVLGTLSHGQKNEGAISLDHTSELLGNISEPGRWRSSWVENNLVERVRAGYGERICGIYSAGTGNYIVNNTIRDVKTNDLNADERANGIRLNDWSGDLLPVVVWNNTLSEVEDPNFYGNLGQFEDPGANPNTPQAWWDGGIVADPPPSQGNGGLPVINFSASAHDGNVPRNTYDNNMATRWSAEGNGQWITHELDTLYLVQSIDIAFFNGNQRSTIFDIELSSNGENWEKVFSGQSSGASLDFESFDIPARNARFVKIVGYGNTVNQWNSLTEIRVNGSSISAPPGGNTITVRARMTKGTSDQLRLRLNNTDVHTWTVSGSSYADYTTSISGSNNVKLFFEDRGTDIQVDYIRIGSTTYQAEDQSTNTSAWQNGSCGGSNSEMMYCRGFIDFGTIDAGTAGSNIATRAQDDPGTRSLDSNDVMEALAEFGVPRTIYPNPATSFIRTNAKSDYAIMIFNTQGKLVLERNNLAGLQTIDISSLKRGFYLVKKIEAGKMSGIKLVVQ